MARFLHNRLVLALLAPTVVLAQAGLADASLEQLLNTPVTSVSKKEQALARTAAAVFVLTQEDIRRSGAETIPDLLRLVPGVEVAQINGDSWAISIRGFNQRYADKLLVLIDGRSLYASTFGGVFWDQSDVPLHDIERIEVIRGPGASVWGANAVNGVINVITKSAKSTKGEYAEASAGSGGGEAQFRYGSSMGSTGSYRLYGSVTRFNDTILPGGGSAQDSWLRSRAGFRSDWDLTPTDSLTVEGSAFANRSASVQFSNFVSLPPLDTSQQINDAAGLDVLARWTHTSASGADSSLQVLYDHYRRNEIGIPEVHTQFDVEFKRHSRWGGRQDVVWGVEYRALSTNLASGYIASLRPPIRVDSLGAAFFQDEIRVADRLWLTIGSKLEHNSYTGFEFEPNARIAWTPSDRHTIWASASRAIRQPTRLEDGVYLPLGSVSGGPGLVYTFPLMGNAAFKSEELRDFEVGYRAQWSPEVSFDASTFFSNYHRLSSFDTMPPVIIPGALGVEIQVPVRYGNGTTAIDYGGEAFLNWKPSSRFRAGAGYSVLHMNVRAPSDDPYTVNTDLYAPQNSLQIRSSLSVTRRLEWNQALYWTQSTINRAVPSHYRLDSRIEYRLSERVALSVMGQNLLAPGFLEFGNFEEFVGTMAPRTIAGKVSWTF